VAGGKLLSELEQNLRADDGSLIGEDLVAIVVAHELAMSVEPAGVDGGVEAPAMHGQGEVMAHQWNFVFGRSFLEQGVGAAAIGALIVNKLDQSHAGSGGRLEGGGVVHLRCGRRAKLGVCTGGGEQSGGKSEHPESGKTTGKCEKTSHSDWTAPYGLL